MFLADICDRTALFQRNNCVRLPYYRGPGVNYTEAVRICAELGGRLAEVESNEEANNIATMVARRWKGTPSGMEVWLNSRYLVSE